VGTINGLIEDIDIMTSQATGLLTCLGCAFLADDEIISGSGAYSAIQLAIREVESIKEAVNNFYGYTEV
jgi:hypothetical protein